MNKRTAKLSHNQKAVNRIVDLLAKGVVVTVPAFVGYITVGPCQLAVGGKGFAVYGYRAQSHIAREFIGELSAAESAAWVAVLTCGSTRTREAAISKEKTL